MKRFSIILISAFSLLVCNLPGAAMGGSGPSDAFYIDFYAGWQVVWMHDSERLALNLNQAFYDDWGEPLFASIAAAKPRYMDKLLDLIDWYDIRWFGDISNEPGFYTDERNADAFDELVERGKSSLQNALLAAAYVEESNISEYRASISGLEMWYYIPGDGMQLLVDAYHDLLNAAYVNLTKLVSRVDGYSAQILTQADVDAIIEAETEPADADFVLNGGLTDVWYNPATNGQGFFIAVYEKSASVFVSWLTFDMDLADPGVTAHLGAPHQRWLTAQGSYRDNLADLVVYSASGGVFNVSPPVPVLESVGHMTLQFDDCDSGTITYDLPDLGESGSIPIQRLASDNRVVCKIMIPLVP